MAKDDRHRHPEDRRGGKNPEPPADAKEQAIKLDGRQCQVVSGQIAMSRFLICMFSAAMHEFVVLAKG